MKEYDKMLSDIVNNILSGNTKDIEFNDILKNTLDINLYKLLINLNKKEFKYKMDSEEEKAVLEFIRLLNNYKVQIELKRKRVHLEESASKALDAFYRNEDILLNYLSNSVVIEDMLLSGDEKGIDNLIIDISCKKKEKDKIYLDKNTKIMEYVKLLNENKFNVSFDTIKFGKEEISVLEFKKLFNYLLNVDNYDFSYKSSKIKNLQLNIVNNIIDNLNCNDINLNRISKIIIPLLLNSMNDRKINDKEVSSNAFKIENISINDLLSNKNNVLVDNVAKVKFGGNDIALSNGYLFDKIMKVFSLGKYYFIDDLFIIDDRDFKCSICINKMIDYLVSMI